MFGRTAENHPMFGNIHSEKSKALMREYHKNKSISVRTKALMSEAKTGPPRGAVP